MLSVRNLQASYGAAQVLFDVSFDIKEGEVVTLLGRNGMGKTTTIRSIMGLLTLGAAQGTSITVTAKGPDATICLQAIDDLLANRFGEDE